MNMLGQRVAAESHDMSEDGWMLVPRIRAALSQARPGYKRIRISVADKAVWEQSSNGEQVLVRWLCWSVSDESGEIVAPTFEVLSEVVTRERLAEELPKMFPGVVVVVDGDIES